MVEGVWSRIAVINAPRLLNPIKRGTYHHAVKRRDEGNVDAAQQPVVEDERRYGQPAGATLIWRLHEHRDPKIEMPVIFAEDDLVTISFEHPENTYSIARLTLEIDCSFETERPHENVTQSQQCRDPSGLLCKDVPRKCLHISGGGFRQVCRKSVGKIGLAIE